MYYGYDGCYATPNQHLGCGYGYQTSGCGLGYGLNGFTLIVILFILLIIIGASCWIK